MATIHGEDGKASSRPEEEEVKKSPRTKKGEFVPRADDAILATFPKCGTTWLKALAFSITNRSRHMLAHHPLLTRHPQDTVPFLELPNRQIQPLAYGWKLNNAKVLFLGYEEMMSDLVKEVKRLAEILGAPFTNTEERDAAIDEVVRLCSFEHFTGLEVNSTGVADRIGGFPMENSTCFRRGKVGDWVNHLNPEMAQQLDSIVKEKLKGSGLTF
ncbi:hypothetical protein C2845_PM05G23710 [Panicum miliaceum]|uniref:Sulfotransferase n=1 Tax=Panicum miliaceum TaxID=4540 RepID=A0A3L6SYA8_PANMI|nr:hypothetical protein C2845_PM05G23710 [Panicum miliaceum]